MKTKLQLIGICHLLSAIGLSAFAQGTAFTYQGRLNSGTNPASGHYDLRFTLYGVSSGGSAVGGPVTNALTAVSNGLFTAAIDFGAGIFTGGSNWLEIAVRTNGNGSFTTLSPRQALTPTPYAITAGNLAAVVQFNTITPDNLATVSGGYSNRAIGFCNLATIGGGGYNTVSDQNATVSGGAGNSANAEGATVGGGELNTASGQYGYATVGGGYGNSASTEGATVGGGLGNSASGWTATIGGGSYNTVAGDYSTVGGGHSNTVHGYYATVPGGDGNNAAGDYSFAAGYHALASLGSFVWSDNSGSTFASTAQNQFAVRSAGGVLFSANVQIGTNNSDYHRLALGGGNSSGFLYGSFAAFSDGIHLGYNYYADAAGGGHVVNAGGGTSRITTDYGGIGMYIGNAGFAPTIQRFEASISGVTVYGTFNNMSDRNAKQDFAPVSSSQILEKVTRLPVSEWSYKEDSATRHIGPVAQDFNSVFNIGTDDKHIAPIDEGGVALAAIQGLNQKVDSETATLRAENAKLKQRLETLERLMNRNNGGAK